MQHRQSCNLAEVTLWLLYLYKLALCVSHVGSNDTALGSSACCGTCQGTSAFGSKVSGRARVTRKQSKGTRAVIYSKLDRGMVMRMPLSMTVQKHAGGRFY